MHGVTVGRTVVARAAAVVVALFTLAGCYVAKSALITPETADYPVPHRTHFDGFLPSGRDWRPQGGRTLGIVDGYYRYIQDGETRRSAPFLLKQIAPGRYVAQMSDATDLKRVTEYYYELIDFDGTTAVQYQPACAARQEWLERKLIASAERTSTGMRCVFTSFESLKTVLQEAAKNAIPEARFVRTEPSPAPR